MLSFLTVQDGKPMLKATATAAMKRGTPIENGEYFAYVEKNYDGMNAVIDPKWTDSDDIANGAEYVKVPTVLGERYATTELTKGTLTDGKAVVVTNGKFVAAGTSTAYNWVYHGEYANPYGVTMYIVERVPAKTTSAS